MPKFEYQLMAADGKAILGPRYEDMREAVQRRLPLAEVSFEAFQSRVRTGAATKYKDLHGNPIEVVIVVTVSDVGSASRETVRAWLQEPISDPNIEVVDA